jgi:hypothetical protein
MEMDGDAQHPSFRRYIGADSWSPYPYQKAAVPLETLLSLQMTTLKTGRLSGNCRCWRSSLHPWSADPTGLGLAPLQVCRSWLQRQSGAPILERGGILTPLRPILIWTWGRRCHKKHGQRQDLNCQTPILLFFICCRCWICFEVSGKWSSMCYKTWE